MTIEDRIRRLAATLWGRRDGDILLRSVRNIYGDVFVSVRTEVPEQWDDEVGPTEADALAALHAHLREQVESRRQELAEALAADGREP